MIGGEETEGRRCKMGRKKDGRKRRKGRQKKESGEQIPSKFPPPKKKS